MASSSLPLHRGPQAQGNPSHGGNRTYGGKGTSGRNSGACSSPREVRASVNGFWDFLVLGGFALLSAFIGSVAGSGGSTLLLPVLVLYFGILDAVPVIVIANLSANLSRVAIYRREIVFPVVGWFVLGAVPPVVLGTYLFTVTPPEVLIRLLGALLISLVVWRRLRPRPPGWRSPAWFLPLGAVFGFLEGIVGSVGPLMAPFFLAFGLLKGAYIGTDALATVAMQGVKLAVFGASDWIAPHILIAGLVLVPFMVAGTILGKLLLERISGETFARIVEIMLVLAGLNFLIRG